jgi:hypothetical protein
VLALSIWGITTPFIRTNGPATEKEKKVINPKLSSRPPTRSPDFVKIGMLVGAVAVGFVSQKIRATLHPLSAPYSHPTAPIRILSSVQSNTGVIIVGEVGRVEQDSPYWSETQNTISEARYLRASHSLLGGVWINSKAVSLDVTKPVAVDSQNKPLGDSVYSTFVLQEAVRLFKDRVPKTALTM